MKSAILFFILFLSNISLKAQEKYFLEIKPVDPAHLFMRADIQYNKQLNNKQECYAELRKYLLQLYENGYLTASFDGLEEAPAGATAYITTGEIYKWAYLKKGNTDEGALSKIGFREKIYRKKLFDYKQVTSLFERLLVYYENNGYPFASVRMDSTDFSNNAISGTICINKNKLVSIDSIIIEGDAAVLPVYIYNYINIKPGNLYDESQLSKAGQRIQELAFIKQSKSHRIIFTDESTILYLYLDNKKASQFNGVLGILPNSESTGELLVTGDARLHLRNSFGRGEQIALNWRSLQPGTQDMNIQSVLPFIFSTPFGADIQFKLYKRDTSFININTSFGAQYLLKGNNYMKAFINKKSTSLISVKGFENAAVLPANSDVRTNIYGLGYHYENLDYRLNPRKGYIFSVSVGAGNKRIIKKQGVNPVLYDSLQLKSVEYNAGLLVDIFFPLKNRSVIGLGIKSAYVFSESMFENELYRIGGLLSLRGFDEESILASAFSVFTLEYRFLLEQNSYLYSFFDWAYYENQYKRSQKQYNWTDTPLGFGAGISFETKAGIFSISYALGRQFNNPIVPRSAKIHFGIVSRF